MNTTAGFTKFNNRLLERIIAMKLSSTEYACLLLFIRKIIGWKDKSADEISISQFMKYTRRSHRTVVNALDTLRKKRLICLLQKGDVSGRSNLYGLGAFLFPEDLVHKFTPRPSKEKYQKLVNKDAQTIDIIKENTINAIMNKELPKIIKPF